MKRLESSNTGLLQAAYTGALVERFWKLPFRPLRVFGSLGIAEPPWSFVNEPSRCQYHCSLTHHTVLERDYRDSKSSSAKLWLSLIAHWQQRNLTTDYYEFYYVLKHPDCPAQMKSSGRNYRQNIMGLWLIPSSSESLTNCWASRVYNLARLERASRFMYIEITEEIWESDSVRTTWGVLEELIT